MAENKNSNIEREYVIPLRKEWLKTPRYKRANKAVKAVKEFLVRHMKIRDRDLNKIKVDKYLNEAIWARSIKKPPVKIKVKAIKEGDFVRAELVEFSDKLKFKKQREEKASKNAKEKSEANAKKAVVAEKPEEKPSNDKEEKEKKASVEEAGKDLAKLEAKKQKHVAQPENMKQQKRTPQRKALAK